MSVDLDALPIGTCHCCCQRPAVDRATLCAECRVKIMAEPRPELPLDPARVVRAYAWLERHLARLYDWLERAEAMLNQMPTSDPRTAAGWATWHEVKEGHDELLKWLTASYSGVRLEAQPLVMAAKRHGAGPGAVLRALEEG